MGIRIRRTRLVTYLAVVPKHRGSKIHLGVRGPNGEWPDRALCGIEAWSDAWGLAAGPPDITVCVRCLSRAKSPERIF